MKKCDICHGNGIIKKNDDYIMCECVKKAQIISRLISNGFPKKYIDYKLDKINEILSNINDIENIQNFYEDINNKNLLILSDNKTNIIKLESMLSNDLSFRKNDKNNYFNILFVTAEDIIQTYSNVRFSNDKNKMDKILFNVDILILNFIGNESESKTTNYGRKYINNLITSRIFDCKTTIISATSNLLTNTNYYGDDFLNLLNENFYILKLDNINDTLINLKEN